MRRLTLCLLGMVFGAELATAREGYYRFPTLGDDVIVFAAEGDLWSVPVEGGLARRLTSHAGPESHPAISPDGLHLAFAATYEGPTEVYTMPVAGGLPQRWTFEPDLSIPVGWKDSNTLLYVTRRYSTLPNPQLVELDIRSGERQRVPLAEASEASYSADEEAFFFVRPAFHRNVTKRYRGGTARKIWRFAEDGGQEAIPLTAEYSGESHTPMPWNGRVYFVSDRDGTMNVWSVAADGSDARQHTGHSGWDVRDPDLHEGKIVYQLGADLFLLDIEKSMGFRLPIELASDFDHTREKWVSRPLDYLTSAHLHPSGESLVLTARGRVFVAPVEAGRLVRASSLEGVRFRDAVFMPDGDQLLVLQDSTGELELTTMPANGVGEMKLLTDDGTVLRFRGYPSPDGKQVAYTDNNADLWLLTIESGEQKRLSAGHEGIGDVVWAPDSRWLVFGETMPNTYVSLFLYSLEDGVATQLTSDRVNSFDPSFGPDGDFLYFLSDRNLRTLVGGPWGPRQPEAYFDRSIKIYELALRRGLRSPFKDRDELAPEPDPKEKSGAPDSNDNSERKRGVAVKRVEVDLVGISGRIREVPISAGNYSGLQAGEDALFWLERDSGPRPPRHLMAIEIGNDGKKPERLVEKVTSFELSLDREKALVRREKEFFVFDADTEPPKKLSKHRVDLSGWSFAIDPVADWKQIFVDAWRLERDYFYDRGMHGVDWQAVLDKHLPLVERVTTREELSDLIGWVVGELSALHTSVRGGDLRRGAESIEVAGLGARWQRREDLGGYRIEQIYRSDPDYPHQVSPLAEAGLEIDVGDVIQSINGASTLSVVDPGSLLRGQADRQVLLGIAGAEDATERQVIVVPTTDERSLRYRDWEYSRRLRVEDAGAGALGYVHLRSMGSRDLETWYRDFYPVFDRQGLIVDVRHNTGGNIDSLILEKLMRRAWFYWHGRSGRPSWNMQYAFRGHMVVLCDEDTASDGEAFAEGFRRLGLGPVIGTRTWGGEIWLSSSNRLSDGGLARAPMWGVYGPEGEWLIEGHGVVPDIEVDNPPHATFGGEDAQLEAAIEYLLGKIEEDPREVPEPPPFPNKAFAYPR